jgi:hypothetical protein
VPAATNDVFVKSVRMGLTQTLGEIHPLCLILQVGLILICYSGRATEILDEETKAFLAEKYPYSEGKFSSKPNAVSYANVSIRMEGNPP